MTVKNPCGQDSYVTKVAPVTANQTYYIETGDQFFTYQPAQLIYSDADPQFDCGAYLSYDVYYINLNNEVTELSQTLRLTDTEYTLLITETNEDIIGLEFPYRVEASFGLSGGETKVGSTSWISFLNPCD